jgi:glycosyltransferase involved in cell wall biosynthesis
MPPKVLIIADWYAPGYKAGGLITALSNLADSIGDRFDLRVFTRDRDLTDGKPYSHVHPKEWQSVGPTRVMYTSDLSHRHLRNRIVEVMPDIIYLNSFFSSLTIKTLCLRKLGLLPPCAFVLAPRGEFSPGALDIKSLKKTIFMTLALRAGLYRDLIWHATSDLEAEHIAEVLRSAGRQQPYIRVASDLPSSDWLRTTPQPPRIPKNSGGRFLWISRISRNKNLSFALDALSNVKGNVTFDVFGPIDDEGYWNDCQLRMQRLPNNVVARYHGSIPRVDIQRVARNYDFFLLPTQGENFGYAILEAMAAGCPVILSDQTPWRVVSDQGIGWTLPLEDLSLWHRTLQQCVDLEPETYASMSRRARNFVESWAKSANRGQETTELFDMALRRVSETNHPGSLAPPPECRSFGAEDADRGTKEGLR